MAINERLIDTAVAADGDTGNAGEEGLILHLDANDVDSYDGDGDEWIDITNHEYTPTTNVSEHFNTVLYPGNGGTKEVTGVGFRPDLVWIKRKNGTGDPGIIDVIRGNNSALFTNSQTDEAALTGGNISMDVDGFDINTYGSTWANLSNGEYAAWCFKAGGAPNGSDKVSIDGTSYADEAAAGLTAGSASVVNLSANTKLGFSIVETGTYGSSEKSYSHGLGVKPELIIVKSINDSSDWFVWTEGFTNSQKLLLNSTGGKATHVSLWGASDTTPHNSNDFTFWGTSGQEYIAYCFASKRGVSKVGSFVGTGAAGKKITLGFEPAWILTKRSSSAGADWAIIDNKRSTDSDKNDYLRANSGAIEGASGSGITFDTDGFTFSGSSFNTSNATHIYYAIAKNTNETSLIPDTNLQLHLDADSFPEYGEDGHSNTPSTWTDSSSNSNDGTISGATFDSELGNWLDFDGSNDFVLPSHTPYQSTSSLTMSAWINPDNVTQLQGVFSLRGGSSSRVKFFLGIESEALRLDSASTTGFITLASGSTNHKLSTNKWHHIAATIDYSSKQFNLYLDGNLVSSGTDSSLRSGSTFNVDKFYIGANYNAQFFNGQIGQVRVYDTKLSQAQIRQNLNFTKPSYPNGYNGVLGGGVTSEKPTWNSDGYFDFDGSNDYISIPSTATTPIDFTGKNYSIASWVNRDVNTVHIILAKYGIIDSLRSINFSIQHNGNLNLYERYGSTGTGYNSTSNLSLNTWHHICLVRYATEVKFYIDGVLINTVSATGTPNSGGTQNVNIGSQANGNYSHLDGQLSKLRVYDKTLDGTEIATLHSEGR